MKEEMEGGREERRMKGRRVPINFRIKVTIMASGNNFFATFVVYWGVCVRTYVCNVIV